MGLYDREYYREEQPARFAISGGRTMVTNLILVNVAIFVADLLSSDAISDSLKVQADLFSHPWQAWQLLTAGFVHDPHNLWHIGVNMFVLWLFGRDVEGIYGRMEFLRIYLCLVVLSSLAWVVAQVAMHDTRGSMMGASGAVMGVMVLYVLHFPRRVLYFWGVFPVPAWAVGALYVGLDLIGWLEPPRPGEVHVAYEAHLAGALCGFLYYWSGINLGRLLPNGWRLPGLSSRPRLRVHNPSADRGASLDQRVDAILDKVNRAGIDSLSADERRVLEDASRRYQHRRS
jgi:membrane associated rhomboid family serine protease